MIDQLETAVVPNAALECATTKSRFILTAVRNAVQHSLLPAVELDRRGLRAPRRCFDIALSAILV